MLFGNDYVLITKNTITRLLAPKAHNTVGNPGENGNVKNKIRFRALFKNKHT